ncbi:MAG: flagellar basal body-associated FliL family protein [Candidatus Brocadia sinica]|nr:flagellar basal body-associated FliL family protein [Candidatus Brocadia sinica]NUO04974.1 flagellar basal body-associated FliL family protein [Candidatus Brocadia sinica]
MAKNTAKSEIEETLEEKIADQPTNKGKGNKTLIMMGGVVLISVGCAFVFVSKVYPSLIGNTQPDVMEQDQKQAEETADEQTAKLPEIKKEPVSTSKKKDEKGKEDKKEVAEESMIVPLDTVIVNLCGSGGRRYLKAKINLEARDEDVKKKIEARSVQIKDRLISILSSKTLEDAEGLEGQESLRREIKDAVDVVLKVEDGVLQVYFTEFVIQ